MSDIVDELRPTTAQSSDSVMERASPFTFQDSDGHSSIASPVISAVASEYETYISAFLSLPPKTASAV